MPLEQHIHGSLGVSQIFDDSPFTSLVTGFVYQLDFHFIWLPISLGYHFDQLTSDAKMTPSIQLFSALFLMHNVTNR